MTSQIVLFTTWFTSNPRRARIALAGIGAALLLVAGLNPEAAVLAGQATGGVH
jgi:hypothetical protein